MPSLCYRLFLGKRNKIDRVFSGQGYSKGSHFPKWTVLVFQNGQFQKLNDEDKMLNLGVKTFNI